MNSRTLHPLSFSRSAIFRSTVLLSGILLSLASLPGFAEAPPPAAEAAFDSYAKALEARLDWQHRSPDRFLADGISNSQSQLRLLRGELIVERISELSPHSKELQGALLHHWRGSAFLVGATAADFERLMRDFNSYPQHFAPQVLHASVLVVHGADPDHLQVVMRVRQQHVITVVLDTDYDVTFGRIDAHHGFSDSRSTCIREIDSTGTAHERALDASEEHGFLWRQNTYWSYVEQDGGLYVQAESVSLTRSVPVGLGWAVQPFVDSIPRESLQFTLNSMRNALQKESLHAAALREEKK